MFRCIAKEIEREDRTTKEEKKETQINLII
jgi:hypothetical protein